MLTGRNDTGRLPHRPSLRACTKASSGCQIVGVQISAITLSHLSARMFHQQVSFPYPCFEQVQEDQSQAVNLQNSSESSLAKNRSNGLPAKLSAGLTYPQNCMLGLWRQNYRRLTTLIEQAMRGLLGSGPGLTSVTLHQNISPMATTSLMMAICSSSSASLGMSR